MVIGGMVFLAAMLAVSVPVAEQAAIFRSAGFKHAGSAWKSGNCDGMESESYSPGSLDRHEDLNGDGRPEAVVTEGGAICYGMTGQHFWLLSKQADGTWKVMVEQTAMPEFLPRKGTDGWPDIQLGGPGFCFPILRWNGKRYFLHRHEYEGRRCAP